MSCSTTDLFKQGLNISPLKIAVSFGERTLSYLELNALSNRLAKKLQESGVGSSDVIAIGLERSTEQIICLLAVLKTGAAVHIVTPSNNDNNAAMLAELNAKFLLVDSSQSIKYSLGNCIRLNYGHEILDGHSDQEIELSNLAPNLNTISKLSIDNHFNGLFATFSKGEAFKIDGLDNAEKEVEKKNSFSEETIEEEIKNIWTKYLSLENIDRKDNFFELGGTSWLGLKILGELKSQYSIKMSVAYFFEDATIKNIVDFAMNKKEKIKPIYSKQDEKEIVNNDIAIIAMEGVFPGAENMDVLWEKILNNENLISKFEKDLVDPSTPDYVKNDENFVRAKGFYPDYDKFDARYFGITPNEAELMDPQQRKLLELSVRVLERAGYASSKYDGEIGVYVGAGNNSYHNLVHANPDKVAKVGAFNVSFGNEKDYIAPRVSHKLNLTGPSLSIHTACSTSLVAIIQAVDSLRNNQCDMALAGGISITGHPYAGYLFQEGGIFSKDGVCRPFDHSATGTIFNDGAGLVLIKRLKDAQRDGDEILAVIKGVGLNNDGASKMSFSAPSLLGQAGAIQRAHHDAGVNIDDIGYVEAHGTATPVGDPIEIEGLKAAFDTKKKNFCYLGSLKANVGHLTAAAGVAGLMKTVKAVQTGIIPGVAGFEKLNTNIDLDESPFMVSANKNKFETKNRIAGISSFGVGGTNAHIVIENYISGLPHNEDLEETPEDALQYRVSAKSREQLEELAQSISESISTSSTDELTSIAATLEKGREDHSYRRFITSSKNGDLKSSPIVNNQRKRELAFSFPGQGAQYSKMGKDLLGRYDIFRESFYECRNILLKYCRIDLEELISTENENINNTQNTQPLIFSIEYSMAKLFESFGIVADVYIGHSIGEFCAATLAGVFTLDDALKMVAKRGELMSKLEPGKMLSVVSNLENIQEFLGEDIQLAAINSKLACVVAGTNEAVDKLKTKLAKKEVGFKELKTSHAFHSAMMDSILSEYESFLEDISFKMPKTKILSTVTTNYESEKFTKPAYWAMHMRETVKFYPAIKKMIQADSFHFIEMGPGNILSSLGKKTAMELKNKSTQFIPTLNIRKMNEYDSVNNAISELWQIDHIIEQYADGKFKKVVLPPYPFTKKRIWITPETKQLKNENIGKTIMSTNNELLKAELIEIFEDASGIDIAEFSHDTSFLEMGMDSLFLTQIALNLKRKLKIEISFRQLMEDFRNLDLLSKFLSDKVTLEASVQVEQVTAPAPAPAPVQVATPAPVAPVPVQIPVQTTVYQSAPASGNIQDLINKQLEIMGQQMQLLAGQPVTTNTQVTTQPIAEPMAPAVAVPIAPVKTESTPKFKRGTEVDNVAKAFGAAPRINTKKSNTATGNKNEFLNEMIRDYLEKTKGSKKFTQDSRKLHADPRVVSGFKPESKEFVYPIVVEKSLAQSLWDVDGNKYTDITCGFGSNFFGNGNPIIKKLIIEQLDSGIEIGPQHPLAAEVSEMFCELTNTDRAAFCSTGSEAVLGAMRLARTVTGRDLIIVFDGAYHGVMDEVIVRGSKKGRALPASPGITNAAVSNMLVLEYGTEESLAKVRELASTAAAIMVEPVQSRRADFHPKEFLQELRKITTQNESCLIFDEVITGFRIHPGGAQAYFDVKADIASYGKIIGGGLPIGVIAGKAEFMDALDGGQWQYGDDSLPTVGVTYFAGTFCRHPLALAAAKGALTILAEGGEKMLNDLSQRAQAFVDEINDFSAQVESPFRLVNFGSLMKPKWKEDAPYSDLFFLKLRLEGVHAIDGFPWFVNLAHTDEDLKFVVAAVKRSIRALQAMDIMPGKKVTFLAESTFDESAPPRVGAKIGRNEQGNPAWYIQDENNKDNYIEIEQ